MKLRVYQGLEWHFNYDVGRPCRCLSRLVTDTWHLSGSDSDNTPAASWVKQSCSILFTKLWWGGKFTVDPNCKLLPINTITAVAVTKPWSNTARRVISSPQLESNPGLAATAHPHSPTVHWMCHPLNFSHGGTTAAIRGHMISLHILMTDSTAACYLYPPSHLWIISDKWFQTVPLVTLAGPRLARSGNWVSPSFRPNVDDSDHGHESQV